MEFNKKARGQKHHNNKARYKDKTKVISKSTHEKRDLSKIKDTDEPEKVLTSNWHQYEELSSEDAEDDSTNFSLLAQAPISHGGHFQFKSDKNIESEFDFESLKTNKMFALDLHLLESSLNTIPFHDRCGLDKNYLTDSQTEEIYETSHQNKIQYESYLKLNAIVKDFSTQVVSDNNSEKCKELIENVKDEVDLLLDAELSDEGKNIPVTKKVNNLNVDPQSKEKQHLEEWLDDILND